MGMFLCKSHGEIVASFVSPNVAAAVAAGTDLDVLTIAINAGFGVWINQVDQGFVAEIVGEGLLSTDSLTGVSEESSWEISCRLKPVCAKCLEEWAPVTVHALIANLDAYDGRPVRVVGYVISQFEIWALYDSETDRQNGPAKSGIWLETYDTPYAQVNEGYAIVEGTFDAASRGHLGMWSGTIRDITRLELCPPHD